MRWPRRTQRRILFSILGLAILSITYGLFIGWTLTHPKRAILRTNPGYWGLSYQKVSFPSAEGNLQLKGWWIPAPGARMTVVMAHGYTANREMDGLPGLLVAGTLHEMDANVLLFDFRGEGASPGHLVSAGVYEQWDVVGAAEYAQQHLAKGMPVAVFGFSMGASAAILGAEDDPHIAAVIADSPYANLGPYLQKSLPYWTDLPAFPFNSIILGFLPMMTGIDLQKADPLDRLPDLGTRPLLLIAGLKDKTILPKNSLQLAIQAKKTDPHVSLWMVPLATHVAAFQLRPVAYAMKLYDFLKPLDPALKMPPAHPFGP